MGLASLSINNSKGGLSSSFISGNGWLLHVLKELALYLDLIHASSLSKFTDSIRFDSL